MPRLVGTCPTMCPSREVNFRYRNGLIHPLESVDPTLPIKQLKPDPEKMVKEYTRSAAGRDHLVPALLRPFEVLDKTVKYLLRLFEERKNESKDFDLVYLFVSDRLRACRQDMILQRLPPNEVQHLMEQMLPFYLETDYQCKLNRSKVYDWKLHNTQLEECFSRWAESIADTKTIDPEVCAAYILSHFDDVTVLRDFLPLLESSRRQSMVNLILSIISVNFVRFFRLLFAFPPIVQYSLTERIAQIRLKALENITIAYKSATAKFPISVISRWLYIPESSLRRILDIEDDECIILSQLEVYKVENCKDKMCMLISLPKL